MKLEVTGLTKCYGKTRALDGLSLAVESSRVLVLIGPSGGGKARCCACSADWKSPMPAR